MTEESEYRTQLSLQVSPPRQYSECPDVLTTNVSLHRVCLALIGRLNAIVYSQGNYLKHSPQAPRFNYTPPGETLFADPPNSPCTHTAPTSQSIPYSHTASATSLDGNPSIYRSWCVPNAGKLREDFQPVIEELDYWGEPLLPLTASRPLEGPLYTSPYNSPGRRTGDEVPGEQLSRGTRYPTSDTRTDSRVADSPPLGSLLRVMRGAAAPPLISLPPSELCAVHGDANWYAPSTLTCTSEGTNASISARINLSNRAVYLLGIPKIITTQLFGRLRDGHQKAAIKVSGKTALRSRLISKGKEGHDYAIQRRAKGRLGSRASLGRTRPSLGILRMGASRSFHIS